MRSTSVVASLLASVALLLRVDEGYAQACSAACPASNEAEEICVGDVLSDDDQTRMFPVCFPQNTDSAPESVTLHTPGKITIVANVYTGCNAGRRESFQYAQTATSLSEESGNVIFLASLKGGSCGSWGNTFYGSTSNFPWTTSDENYYIRDLLFTNYPHPSYAVVDWDGVVRHKFVGPCCGYEGYYDCTVETAFELDGTLRQHVQELEAELSLLETAPEETPNPTTSPTLSPVTAAPVVEITVTGGSFTSPYYTFQDSEGNTLNPSTSSLLLIPGSTYRFVNGGISSSHPFFISDVGRSQPSTFTIESEGSQTSGLPSGGSLQFQLPSDFDGTLYYYCVPHTSMTNTFQIGDAAEEEPTALPTASPTVCTSEWSEWSTCSRLCGTGVQYRWGCTDTFEDGFYEERACETEACAESCVEELGGDDSTVISVIVNNMEDGLDSPRNIAFSPHPGRHLGSFSEGRPFSQEGDELWIANGNAHDIVIVPDIGSADQASLQRRDRGYYHYMHNITGLAFNNVGNSNRAGRDTYGYFATCQDSDNTYLGMKEPNFFMGPSLYDSSPEFRNLVSKQGTECTPAEDCYFLHADMLHESPQCRGIVHDPELESSYGTVYWAFDGRNGQLVRYDFSQPHGPGLMDHSVAQVRRYPDVQFTGEGPRGVLLGMAIDPTSRVLYVSDPAGGKVLYVHIDSGSFARTARGEYPIYSSRLPSFEYSIYECLEWGVLAEGLETPSGVILHEGTLFVAEYESGAIQAFDVATGERKSSLMTPEGRGLSGLAVAPINGRLFYSNSVANIVAAVDAGTCTGDTDVAVVTDASFDFDELAILQDLHALPCMVSATIPDITYFEQVHLDSGYAAHDPSVQNDTMQDPAAAALANRTDCWYDSPLNFDALLLGGYFCHTCLPDGCFDGGSCTNVQWQGFTCSNEFYIGTDTNSNVLVDGDVFPTLEVDRELAYRFVVNSKGNPVGLYDSDGVTLVEAVEEGVLRFSFAEMPSAMEVYYHTASYIDGGEKGIIRVSTESPTGAPTLAPSTSPTPAPTPVPSAAPTAGPTAAPSTLPTHVPTTAACNDVLLNGDETDVDCGGSCSKCATGQSCLADSDCEGLCAEPSNVCVTFLPTTVPTSMPTSTPTSLPTRSPTKAPTGIPTAAPTESPSPMPTQSPTIMPSGVPTSAPTGSPTLTPSETPKAPTSAPTTMLVTVIQGSLELIGVTPDAFKNDAGLQSAVQTDLANAAGVDRSDVTILGVTNPPGIGRRALQEAGAVVAFRITVDGQSSVEAASTLLQEASTSGSLLSSATSYAASQGYVEFEVASFVSVVETELSITASPSAIRFQGDDAESDDDASANVVVIVAAAGGAAVLFLAVGLLVKRNTGGKEEGGRVSPVENLSVTVDDPGDKGSAV